MALTRFHRTPYMLSRNGSLNTLFLKIRGSPPPPIENRIHNFLFYNDVTVTNASAFLLNFTYN